MYDPWNFGGAKSFIFRGLGGLAPLSPYVEPPLAESYRKNTWQKRNVESRFAPEQNLASPRTQQIFVADAPATPCIKDLSTSPN